MDNEIFKNVETLPEGLQFLTYEEVAVILKVKRSTVRTWVYRGEIKSSVQMGKKSLIPLKEVQRFVNERIRHRELKKFPLTKKVKEQTNEV